MSRVPVVGFSLKNYINTVTATRTLVQQLDELCGQERSIEQFLLPSLGTIESASYRLFRNQSRIGLGAQNIAPAANGAWTGEYSIETLAELGGRYVELAHHERLQYFHEDAAMVNRKLKLTLGFQMVPVLCIGEGEQRLSADGFRNKVGSLLSQYLAGVADEDVGRIIFAYEPGWAIGQSEAASAQEVHRSMATIRDLVKTIAGAEAAKQARLIYGGSISKASTPAIVDDQNTDGIFVGRFGHQPANYQAMVEEVKAAKLN